ncbi:hypothetical protein SNEBB_004422 [Seison nebaliae]|nr:hypothetical protein SNEBB_004422 [Seison nebaliae]
MANGNGQIPDDNNNHLHQINTTPVDTDSQYKLFMQQYNMMKMANGFAPLPTQTMPNNFQQFPMQPFYGGYSPFPMMHNTNDQLPYGGSIPTLPPGTQQINPMSPPQQIPPMSQSLLQPNFSPPPFQMNNQMSMMRFPMMATTVSQIPNSSISFNPIAPTTLNNNRLLTDVRCPPIFPNRTVISPAPIRPNSLKTDINHPNSTYKANADYFNNFPNNHDTTTNFIRPMINSTIITSPNQPSFINQPIMMTSNNQFPMTKLLTNHNIIVPTATVPAMPSRQPTPTRHRKLTNQATERSNSSSSSHVKVKKVWSNLGMKLLNEISEYRTAEFPEMMEPFRRLPNRQQHTDYYLEIKNAVSLCSLKKKYRGRVNVRLDSMAADLHQMFHNAMQYNIEDSVIYKNAKRLDKLVDEISERLLQSNGGDEKFKMVEQISSPGPIPSPKSTTVRIHSIAPPLSSHPITTTNNNNNNALVNCSNLETLLNRMQQFINELKDIENDDDKSKIPLLASFEGDGLVKELMNSYNRKEFRIPLQLLDHVMNYCEEKLTAIVESERNDDVDEEKVELFKLNVTLFQQKSSIKFFQVFGIYDILSDNGRSAKNRLIDIINGNSYDLENTVKFILQIIFHCHEEQNHHSTNDDNETRLLCLNFLYKPSKSVYPDYYEFTKRPISLRDIYQMNENGIYTSLDQAINDFMEMCTNSVAYNEPSSTIYSDALDIMKLVHEARQFIEWRQPPYNRKLTNRSFLSELIINVFEETIQKSIDDLTEDYALSDIIFYDLKFLYSIDSNKRFIQIQEKQQLKVKEMFNDEYKVIHQPLLLEECPETFFLFAQNVYGKRYGRFDRFQEDFFHLLKNYYFQSPPFSQVRHDLQRLGGKFISTRDRLTMNGKLFQSPAQLYSVYAFMNELKEEDMANEDNMDWKRIEKDFYSMSTELEEIPSFWLEKTKKKLKLANVMKFKFQIIHNGDCVICVDENEKEFLLHINYLLEIDDQLFIYGRQFHMVCRMETFEFHRLLSNEVFVTTQFLTIPIGQVKRRCIILPFQTSIPLYEEWDVEKDVFLCESIYDGQTRIWRKNLEAVKESLNVRKKTNEMVMEDMRQLICEKKNNLKFQIEISDVIEEISSITNEYRRISEKRKSDGGKVCLNKRSVRSSVINKYLTMEDRDVRDNNFRLKIRKMIANDEINENLLMKFLDFDEEIQLIVSRTLIDCERLNVIANRLGDQKSKREYYERVNLNNWLHVAVGDYVIVKHEEDDDKPLHCENEDDDENELNENEEDDEMDHQTMMDSDGNDTIINGDISATTSQTIITDNDESIEEENENNSKTRLKGTRRQIGRTRKRTAKMKGKRLKKKRVGHIGNKFIKSSPMKDQVSQSNEMLPSIYRIYHIENIYRNEKTKEMEFDGIVYLWPHQIKHEVTQTFYMNEVMKTKSVRYRLDANRIVRRCCCITSNTYATCRATEIDCHDHFICDYLYVEEEGVRRKLKQTHQNKAFQRPHQRKSFIDYEIYTFTKPMNIPKIPSPYLDAEILHVDNVHQYHTLPIENDGLLSPTKTKKIINLPLPNAKENNTRRRSQTESHSFLLFASEQRRELCKRLSVHFGEVSKFIGKKWRRVFDAEKNWYRVRSIALLSEKKNLIDLEEKFNRFLSYNYLEKLEVETSTKSSPKAENQERATSSVDLNSIKNGSNVNNSKVQSPRSNSPVESLQSVKSPKHVINNLDVEMKSFVPISPSNRSTILAAPLPSMQLTSRTKLLTTNIIPSPPPSSSSGRIDTVMEMKRILPKHQIKTMSIGVQVSPEMSNFACQSGEPLSSQRKRSGTDDLQKENRINFLSNRLTNLLTDQKYEKNLQALNDSQQYLHYVDAIRNDRRFLSNTLNMKDQRHNHLQSLSDSNIIDNIRNISQRPNPSATPSIIPSNFDGNKSSTNK